MMEPREYFRFYRNQLGFTNQGDAKDFFGAKNIKPNIDYKYIDNLNYRLEDMVNKINQVIPKNIQHSDLKDFINLKVNKTYNIINENDLLPLLNNQGRRPEQVYFSWMRGYIMVEFFSKAIAKIFNITNKELSFIGDDDFSNLETFKRTPKADIEVKYNGKLIRIEVQSGFQGVNDVKEHKVREAKRYFDKTKHPTLCMHFDIFNGQVAFIRLDTIKDKSVNWITRQQMEGQSVFNIDQNYFAWRLTEAIPKINKLDLGI